jgi:AbrB family looped-hinge helix DNA binding protein
MNAVSKLSSKGQLVVPKEERDRLGWQASDRIEFVPLPDGVALRALPRDKQGLTAEQVFAELRKVVRYTGPPVSDEDISAAGANAAAERYRRSCNP